MDLPSTAVDLLVAGAGIAGLHVATQYLKTRPKGGVLLLERNPYLGGRIYTHHQSIHGKPYQWEAGAGRIPTSHKRIIKLIKDYGLTFQHWEAPPNLVDKFPDLIPIYLQPLLALPAHVLAQHTLADLLKQIHGSSATDFIQLFPYWAEFHTLRADVALQTFIEGPLNEKHGWGGCAEGLSALTERMGEDIRARGGEIRLGTSVLEVIQSRDKKHMRVLLETDGKQEWITAKKVVLALDVTSLRHVKGIHFPFLRHLKQEPLLRVYAVFKTHKGRSWFSGMAKQVVPGPIRFFIPMAPEKGLAMISYTEGKDAKHWMDMPEKKRDKEMMKALRTLYPDKEIPDPVMIKFHGWETGCTYWTPGKYDVEEESDKSVQPTSGVYLCSESFAVQQSWMESALVQAEKVLARLG